MHLFFYHSFLVFYKFSLHLVKRWNRKADLWLKGRKQIFEKIGLEMDSCRGPVVWMHCASLGEFEQGRPLLEKIRFNYPGYCIVLTFFSPSGYEIQKNYPNADCIFYLPADSPAHAARFLDLVKPGLILWIKYDYWYYYLKAAASRKIPILLISAIFRERQIFFRWYGQLHREMLQCFTRLFVQNENSVSLLEKIGLSEKATLAGDTRFDRVLKIAGGFEPIPEIEAFCRGKKVIVAGSTWEEDAEELDHFSNTHPALAFIVAPHEIDEESLRDTEKLFKNSIRFSKWATRQDAADPPVHVLIVDSIGILSRLYRYADIAYVGGGFHEGGVHNVLEAAVYGKPVVFGPVYNEYQEAVELIESGGGFSVNSALELEELFLQLLNDKEYYQSACLSSEEYVKSKKGATDSILLYIQENRLLTSL